MSHTDQAFIRAYRTDVHEEPAPVVGATRMEESTHRGPHADFSGAKRPLSEAIAAPQRRYDEPDAEAYDAPIAGVAVASFGVPETARRLAERCGDSYRRMLAYASRSGGVIGFLGAGENVGCTTTTLATALTAAEEGPPVAMIDAAPGNNGLSHSLGFLHARSIATTIAQGGAARDGLIYSAHDNVSLGLAFSHNAGEERLVSGALRSLCSSHAAVLVDLGSDLESIVTQPARGADALRIDAIVIVRRAGHGDADAAFAHRVLAASGQTVVGIIDSFAA